MNKLNQIIYFRQQVYSKSYTKAHKTYEAILKISKATIHPNSVRYRKFLNQGSWTGKIVLVDREPCKYARLHSVKLPAQ